MNFKIGISPVASGQRTSALEVEPQLIVKAGRGSFGLTATASKSMGVAVGENIQFHNNIDGIIQLINSKDEDFALYCEQNGYDLSTEAGKEAVIEEMTTWYLGKGFQQFDRKGNALKVSERVSKAEKIEYIETNQMQLVENYREALIERATADGKDGEELSDEELAAYIQLDDIESGEREQYSGSLTANSAKRIGTGCPLNFTDTHIWGQLRKGATAQQNTIYDIDVNGAEKAMVSNGYEEIEITIYPISFKEMGNVISRNFKTKK